MNLAHAVTLFGLTRCRTPETPYSRHLSWSALMLAAVHLQELVEMTRNPVKRSVPMADQFTSAVGCACAAAYFWSFAASTSGSTADEHWSGRSELTDR